MSAKKQFLTTVKRKLDALKQEVERLQANTDRIDSRDVSRFTAAIQDIIARIQRVEKQFIGDGHQSADHWQTLKRRVEIGCMDIDERIRNARKRFPE
jgi:predicted  nucleic acid-binding Zn-ribbon protein